MSPPASEPDWEPEEITKNDNGSPLVRELFDRDPLVMLGKLVRSVADCHSKIDSLGLLGAPSAALERAVGVVQTAMVASAVAALQILQAVLQPDRYF